MRGEIEQLNLKVEHHPEVTKFAKENLDLRGEEALAGAWKEKIGPTNLTVHLWSIAKLLCTGGRLKVSKLVLSFSQCFLTSVFSG